jgi:Protein of unknown function (DUF3000).
MRQVGGVAAPSEEAAAAFRAAVMRLRSGQEQVSAVRPELAFEDVPAPRTLAPFATAFAATARIDETEVASGRFVLLYDPAASAAGRARCASSSTSAPTWSRRSPRTRCWARSPGPG